MRATDRGPRTTSHEHEPRATPAALALGTAVAQDRVNMPAFAMFSRFFETPPLTRARVWAAYAIAIATDALQLVLGPFGWVFVDEVLDLVAMVAVSRAIGFHVLLLPTFAIEFLPVTDMLPTWTGAVALVVGLRRRQQLVRAEAPATGPIIDV